MARRARRSSSPASRGLSGVADAARARSPATVIQCSRPRMSRLVGLGGRGQRVGRQQPRAVAIAIESRVKKRIHHKRWRPHLLATADAVPSASSASTLLKVPKKNQRSR